MSAARAAEPWWTRAVVYQVYPRSFMDSDGDGVGDLPGVLSRLDHLSDLGVDALWLGPVYPSPQVDNGYDISDYQDVDPTFGTLADLDALIAGLHERGMRLIMDVVVNHTSDQHPWFQDSRSGGPRHDWYWWRPPAPDQGPPNNWGSLFSGPAWTFDQARGQFYLHTFAAGQPDLNWENPQVREAVASMLRWWLDRGVDGFRLDVISMISKDPTLPGGPPLMDGYAIPSLGFGPRLGEYLHELHTRVFAGRDLLTVGEMPGATVEQAADITATASAQLDMVFQFEHVALDHTTSKWDLRRVPLPELKACFARWQLGLAERGWNSLYWDNHDQPRLVSRFGDDGEHRVASATTLATVLHLQRGTPFVYQGDELGMPNAGLSELADYRDVESLNHYTQAVAGGRPVAQVLAQLQAASRDNARTPMPWDGSAGAGFTTGAPWIPIPAHARDVNVAAQRDDPWSVLAHYRRLIALRHQVPAVALGEFVPLLPDDPAVWAYLRRHGEVELLVLANCSAGQVVADVPPGWDDAELLLGNLPEPGAVATLRAWESKVLRRRLPG